MLHFKQRYRVFQVGCAALVTALAVGSVSAQNVLDTTIQTQQEADQQARQSQQRIDNLASETSDLLSEYRSVLREIESMRTYNQQLEKVVASQRQEVESIERQLTELEDTNRDVVPLMLNMVDMLERIVANDIPFLIEERQARVAELQNILDRSDVTTSEKYRRIMEAYTIEMNYGRDVYAYRDDLPESGRTVNFLQVGRTALYYQTLDGEQSGWYNPKTRQFEPLEGGYNNAISEAIAIAQEQAAPDLVRLPLVAPATAQETP